MAMPRGVSSAAGVGRRAEALVRKAEQVPSSYASQSMLRCKIVLAFGAVHTYLAGVVGCAMRDRQHALLGRFLPRLGPLVYSGGPFSCSCTMLLTGVFCSACPEMADYSYSAAAWNGPSSPSGTVASTFASAVKSVATRANPALRSCRRSSM